MLKLFKTAGALIFVMLIIAGTNAESIKAIDPPDYEEPQFRSIEELMEWIETTDAATFQGGRFERGLESIRNRGEIIIPHFGDASISFSSLQISPTHAGVGMNIHHRFSIPGGQIQVNISELNPAHAAVYQRDGVLAYFMGGRTWDEPSRLSVSERIVVVRNPDTGELSERRMTYAFVDELDSPRPFASNLFVLDGFQISVQTQRSSAVAYFNDLILEAIPVVDRTGDGEGQAQRVIRFSIGSTAYTVNGVSHTNDVAPFIDLAHNRTMIPVRAVSDALGAEIDWIAQTGTVQIYTDAGMHQLTAGSPLPDGMGVPVSLQGRVFVPIRYVAEVLGATVRWDEVNSAVYIYQ